MPDVTVDVSGINSPPLVPAAPLPSVANSGVTINQTLTWTGGDPDPVDTVAYDLHFDTDNSPLTQVATDQTGSIYPANGLLYDTTYYWQVVARDSNGAETVGPLWSFTTFTATGDVDNDGLTNSEEIALDTDPFNRDTDEDGIPDGGEVAFGLNPKGG